MKKYLLLALLFSLAFSSVSISLSRNVFILNKGEGAVGYFSIENEGNSKEEIVLGVDGLPTWFFVYPSVVRLEPHESKNVTFYFSNKAPPSTYLYVVRARSRKSGEELKENFVFIVKEEKKEKKEVKWLKLKMPKEVMPGKTAFLEVEVSENLLPSTLDLYLIRNNAIVSTFSKDITKSKETVAIKIAENENPGKYLIRGIIKGEGVINETEFEVEKFEKVNLEKKVEKKIMGKIIKIYAKNVGNVKSSSGVSLELPFYERFVANIEPKANIRRVGRNYEIVWNYSLDPGEKKLIGSVSIDYTPYVLIIFLFLLGLAIILQTSKPAEIKKEFKVIREEEGTKIKVKINVINTSDKEIEGVKVIDFVPKICEISKFQIIEPEVEEEKDSYKLIWNLGSLKPGEERVIAYELILGFGVVGELTLPEPKVLLTR